MGAQEHGSTQLKFIRDRSLACVHKPSDSSGGVANRSRKDKSYTTVSFSVRQPQFFRACKRLLTRMTFELNVDALIHGSSATRRLPLCRRPCCSVSSRAADTGVHHRLHHSSSHPGTGDRRRRRALTPAVAARRPACPA